MPSTQQRLHLSRHVRRAAVMAVVLIAALVPPAVSGRIPPGGEPSGSDFEIDPSANLRVDDPLALDRLGNWSPRTRRPTPEADRRTSHSARAARKTPPCRP